MSSKIKIYFDSGGNRNFLKKYLPYLIFYQYPYDSSDRPKKQKIELAIPSELLWKYAYTSWEESTFSWEDCTGSEKYDAIATIIGKSNLKDILHVDSAYKTGCHIIITSDKTDIWSKRKELESVCGLKIFFHTDEDNIIEYVEDQLKFNEES